MTERISDPRTLTKVAPDQSSDALARLANQKKAKITTQQPSTPVPPTTATASNGALHISEKMNIDDMYLATLNRPPSAPQSPKQKEEAKKIVNPPI